MSASAVYFFGGFCMTDIEKMQPLRHCGTQLIKTERLNLRMFNRSDCDDMFKWAGNPDVVKYLSYYPHKNIDETKKVLSSWVRGYRKTDTYNWAIEYNSIVIGNIAVVLQDDECFSCHLGWQIDKPYWSKGIMTEAAVAVIEFLFENVGYDRITSGCDSRNIGSAKVMQKIGMTLEGIFRRYCYQKDGSIGDKYYYAVLKSDWEQNRLKEN